MNTPNAISDAKAIKVFKIEHDGDTRIALYFDYDFNLIERIKALEGRRYSSSKNCWHLPYTKESYHAFKQLNIPFTIDPGTTSESLSKSDDAGISSLGGENSVRSATETYQNADIDRNAIKHTNVRWNNNYFILDFDYNVENIAFTKSLKRCWWQAENKVWVAKGTIQNLDKINQYFACFSKEEYDKIYDFIRIGIEPVILQLYKTPQFPEKIVLKLKGFRADINFIKSLPDRFYDSEMKRWIVPANVALIKRIKEHYQRQGAKIIDRIAQADSHYTKQQFSTKDRINRLVEKFPIQYSPMIIKVTDAMIREKYSIKSITSYVGNLVKFRKHQGDQTMDQLTIHDANSYLSVLAKNDVSESLLNSVYSAIKLYYDKVSYVPSFDLQKMKRPRKGQYLPVILSRQEIDRMLGSISNTKHLCMLYTLYGAGLRLGELLGLRVEDVLWDRMQMLVKGGKGRKDRVVMLSDTLKGLLERYFDEYQPEYWLFEGLKSGTAYSPRSVQNIVRQAAKNAGVRKKVTPHTLRHCFATHLMDGGLDSRFIQELLGHKDIKTTLIYTHVTNRSMSQITSPLDYLNNGGKKRNS